MAEGLDTTKTELEAVSNALDALAADLPALTSACDSFTQSAAQFASRRAENKQLLSKPYCPHAHRVLWAGPAYHMIMQGQFVTFNCILMRIGHRVKPTSRVPPMAVREAGDSIDYYNPCHLHDNPALLADKQTIRRNALSIALFVLYCMGDEAELCCGAAAAQSSTQCCWSCWRCRS
jgi:hypothetical protein